MGARSPSPGAGFEFGLTTGAWHSAEGEWSDCPGRDGNAAI